MPTYEYICLSCARRIDVLHGIHASGPIACEVCGGTLRKAISAAAVVFKGSGWAKKDAARAASRPASGDSGAEAPASNAEGAKESPLGQGTETETGRPKEPAGKPETSGKSSTDNGSSASKPADSKAPAGKTSAKGSHKSRSGD